MKKAILWLAFILVLSGCKAAKTIDFCEGVSTNGEGVKCGNKFTTGELTMMIKPEGPFNINKIVLNIYKKSKYRTDKFDSLVVDVKPESLTINKNFYFYDEGEFTIEAFGQENKKIAEGKVDIVEAY
jgi:hypothetical protein